MWVSPWFVFTSCPRSLVDSTLVIAFITLAKMFRRPSPVFLFSFIFPPHLSQTESLESILIQSRHLSFCLKRADRTGGTLLPHVWSGPQGHPVQGRGSLLHSWLLWAQGILLRISGTWNSLIFAQGSSRVFLIRDSVSELGY